MMKNILEYKGYHAKVEIDLEDNVLYGKIEGIKDLVNFESESIENLESEFHSAVDDYLEFCKEVGKNPEKEYSGTFNVRIDPELHKQLSVMALKNNESLNQIVEKALKAYVDDTSRTKITSIEQKISILSDVLTVQKSHSKIVNSGITNPPKTMIANSAAMKCLYFNNR